MKNVTNGMKKLAVGLIASLPIVAWSDGSSGEINVPEGVTNTVPAASGAITKTGKGVLVLTGLAADPVGLSVNEGTVRLEGPQPCVSGVTVAAGAVLELGTDEQIADSSNLILHGTFDLNGHMESLQRFDNAPDSEADRPEMTAVLTNSAPFAAKLVVWGISSFYGRISPGVEYVCKANRCGLFGPDGAASGLASLSIPGGEFLPYSDFAQIRFDFEAPADGVSVLALSEIQLTYNGIPLPKSAIAMITEDTSAKLWDDRADTEYHASKAEVVSLTVVLNGTWRVNGYRLATPDNLSRAPSSWKVWGYRWTTLGTVLLDDRKDARISAATSTFSENFRFTAKDRPGSPFGPETQVTMEGTSEAALLKSLRVSNVDPLVTGALVGGGGVLLEVGSVIAPGLLNRYTGVFSSDATTSASWDRFGGVMLDGVRGGAEQRVTVSDAADQSNVRISVTGTEPVSLLLDDASAKIQRGGVGDGEGRLGIVKRGSSTRMLETEDADYTGPTRVESGTLRVQGARTARVFRARYIKILPTRLYGDGVPNWSDTTDLQGDSASGLNWGMNEFQLTDADGNVVSWPEGTKVTHETGLNLGGAPLSNLIDGSPDTRCLVYNAAQNAPDAKTTKKTAYVMIDTGDKGVSFSGYRWYTPHKNAYDSKRTPLEWQISVSQDKATWRMASAAEAAWVSDGTGTPTGLLRGPFPCQGYSSSSGICGVKTLPSGYLVQSDSRATRASALKARYFRFRPLKTASGGEYWQVAEINLYLNGQFVNWNGATASLFGSQVNSNNGSKLENLVNNVRRGAGSGQNQDRCLVYRYPCYVTIDAQQEVAFDAWGFTSMVSPGGIGRTPQAFDFSISSDGNDWIVVGTVLDLGYQEREGEYVDQGPWNVGGRFGIPGRMTSNRIGDDSPVGIANDAVLQIAAEYEKFGPLSGTGSLDLDLDAVAEINLTESAEFGGRVTGTGSIVVSGSGTETFAEADLSGVKALELNAGTIAGSASFGGGDLTVSFGGGATMAALSGIGKLSVSGIPKFRLPDDLKELGSFEVTLFMADSIDETSQNLLRNAEVIRPAGVSPSWKANVEVTSQSVRLSVCRPGLIMLLK